jgi:hypothetical protein
MAGQQTPRCPFVARSVAANPIFGNRPLQRLAHRLTFPAVVRRVPLESGLSYVDSFKGAPAGRTRTGCSASLCE